MLELEDETLIETRGPQATGEAFAPEPAAWLPALALSDAKMEVILGKIAQHWAGYWFGSEVFHVVRIIDSSAFNKRPGAKLEWSHHSASSCYGVTHGGDIELGRHLLKAEPDERPESEADFALLRTLAHDLLVDLARRMDVRAGFAASSSAAHKMIDADEASAFVQFSDDRQSFSLWVGITQQALIALRKRDIPLADHDRVQLVPAITALEDESLAFHPILGTAQMNVADLRSLGVGDVIVLDSLVQGEIDMISSRSGRFLATAGLEMGQEALSLKIHTMGKHKRA